EMYRVLKNDRACLLVLGDVMLGKRRVNMAELAAEQAGKVGFETAYVISDNIPKESKHLMYLGREQGVDKEKVLILNKGRPKMRRAVLPWVAMLGHDT
ncbi:MAG: hypothetical protein QXI97_03750, partial [Nitrososphaerota archaeon]